MALREFEDQAGTRWIVWDTIPANTIGLTDEYRRGWLTFDNGTDRCRVAPIPPDWTELANERLTLLLVCRTVTPTDTEMTGSRTGDALPSGAGRRRRPTAFGTAAILSREDRPDLDGGSDPRFQERCRGRKSVTSRNLPLVKRLALQDARASPARPSGSRAPTRSSGC
jgi:hypothetical protein